MKEAFHFYRSVHRQYLWLHVFFSIILLLTSVFWFVLPFYIVNYGDYEPTLPIKIACLLFLCVCPSFFITLHCWIISFMAAKKWQNRKGDESVFLWIIRFQAMSFFVVIVFTCTIYFLFLVIDLIR